MRSLAEIITIAPIAAVRNSANSSGPSSCDRCKYVLIRMELKITAPKTVILARTEKRSTNIASAMIERPTLLCKLFHCTQFATRAEAAVAPVNHAYPWRGQLGTREPTNNRKHAPPNKMRRGRMSVHGMEGPMSPLASNITRLLYELIQQASQNVLLAQLVADSQNASQRVR